MSSVDEVENAIEKFNGLVNNLVCFLSSYRIYFLYIEIISNLSRSISLCIKSNFSLKAFFL